MSEEEKELRADLRALIALVTEVVALNRHLITLIDVQGQEEPSKDDESWHL